MDCTLTPRQQKVYDFIDDKISNRGYGPTVREIAEFLGIRSPNGVICHLRALERKGMISRTANKSRAIELKHRSQAGRSPGLPMRGRVDNGSCNLFEAPRTLDDLDALQHPKRFLLQYNGEELREWSIVDGDILVIEQGSDGSAGRLVLQQDAAGMLVLGTAGMAAPAHRVAAIAPVSILPPDVAGVVVGIIRTLHALPMASSPSDEVSRSSAAGPLFASA